MIKTVTVENYLGDQLTINLSDPSSSGFAVESIEGLGPVKANINTTEVATNDGSVYNSARLDSRNIVMRIIFVGNNIEELRHKSYKYFPTKKKLRLLFETDRRSATIEGYVESNEPSIFSREEDAQISIICPDPYFYSVGDAGQNTVFYGIDPLFEFQFSNESLTEKLIEFGSINAVTDANVFYDGDSEVGVNITLHAMGPATGIGIYNTGTRESMLIDTDKIAAITGGPITAGDDIIICTVKGRKSARLLRAGEYFNILNALDRGAKWFQLAKGDNVFAYTAETGIINLQFRVQNDTLYEGI